MHKCLHCGNSTLMRVIGKHKKEFGSVERDDYGYDLYILLLCPVCNEVSLINGYWDNTYNRNESIDEYDIYKGDEAEEKELYPFMTTLDLRNVPVKIKHNYERALKVKNVDKESCLVALRTTLECICNDNGATQNSLVKKIEFLTTNGILPKTLKDASSLARKLGNLGAHEGNINIEDYEMNMVIKTIEYIIQYIYILPKEIEVLESKFDLSESKEKQVK